MRWTRKIIVAEIKRLYESGERLNYSAAEANHLNLVRAAAWHFGTWRTAVEAAGIDYESLSRYQRWNRERIIARIQELHAEGADLSWRSVSMEIDPSLAAAALRPNGFDSWRGAIAAAGLDINEITRYQHWNHEKVIKAIQERHKAGKPMSSKVLQTTDQSLFCAARRRFGSWDGALAVAGLDPDKIRLRRHNPELPSSRRKAAREKAAQEKIAAKKSLAKSKTTPPAPKKTKLAA